MSDFYEIDFLDVEAKSSGDAICLRYMVGGVQKIHVVDGGFQDTGDKLVSHIRAHYGAPWYIDHVVATHNDGDHSVGLRAVLESFDVGTLWMLRPWEYASELFHYFNYTDVDRLRARLRSDYSNLAALEEIANRRGIEIRAPFQGSAIGAFVVLAPSKQRFLNLVARSEKTPRTSALASAILQPRTTVLGAIGGVIRFVKAHWGMESFPEEETSAENEMSVVQHATICGDRIMLTADAGRETLSEAIKFAPLVGVRFPGVDRFQVPHHGSRRNVSSEILDKIVGPRLNTRLEQGTFTAVISSAKADEEHPRKAVVRALHHRGAIVLTTEGKSIRSQRNAPDRPGWVPAVTAPYPDEQEEG